MVEKNLMDIPKEKFRFAPKRDFHHDEKFDSKPVGYLQGAFRRFCKNKGAVVGGVVIAVLMLFAIIAPFCTAYTPAYYDEVYASVRPKCALFERLNFWDGCRKKKEVGYISYLRDYALGAETGRAVIKDAEVKTSADGRLFTYRYDTYRGVGFGKYRAISLAEYQDIQRFQDETGRQVLYPIVRKRDRPTLVQDQDDANIYYKWQIVDGKTQPALDENGQIAVNYWRYAEDSAPVGTFAEYTSEVRVAGDGEMGTDGKRYFYVYGRLLNDGAVVEVRTDYYEYYTYKHVQVLKDGIGEPQFLFGTTGGGKDIFACLSHGARFSFIFALLVAGVNFIVGVIYGSIAGYFGGKTDLFMQRFSEILGAVPTMIVITLLKYHMGSSSHALILFIAFFATGWIGMAGTTRMQFYRFKKQEYILAARTLGAGNARIMFKHIFPNGLGTIVTACALVIPTMIYLETNLSYLGIVNLEAGNVTSVGTLIAAGQRDVLYAPYSAFFPCLFLVLLMLSFNLFGNGLRDAFNPSLRGSEE
ncbi:MAG: ABC transporter permease [Clostridiales bacterium]|nr:ABC transporter permease [Clostridiales bacterium]